MRNQTVISFEVMVFFTNMALLVFSDFIFFDLIKVGSNFVLVSLTIVDFSQLTSHPQFPKLKLYF